MILNILYALIWGGLGVTLIASGGGGGSVIAGVAFLCLALWNLVKEYI